MENRPTLPSLFYKAPGKDEYPPKSSSWTNALYDILSCVETNTDDNNVIVIHKNQKFVCTYDKFPKAKHHLLLMCRNYPANPSCLRNVMSLNDLTKDHLEELREFHQFGRSIAAAICGDDKSTSFKLGYHAIPSLHPLHLHIISSDLDSPCVTTRKHITSFASMFFVTADEVENNLESAFVESISLDVRKERAQDVLSNTPLECQYCARAASNVPDWKRHNQTCPMIEAQSKKRRGDKQEELFNSLLGWKSTKVLTKICGRSKKRSREDQESGTNDTLK